MPKPYKPMIQTTETKLDKDRYGREFVVTTGQTVQEPAIPETYAWAYFDGETEGGGIFGDCAEVQPWSGK